MPWFKVDDKLHDHRKTRAAGVEAMGLWALAGSWCADHLTDGFVPEDVASRWTRACRRLAGRLVTAGLWTVDTVEGEPGWRFHGWSEMQPTRAQVEADRAAARERMAVVRQNRTRSSPDVRPNNTGTYGRSSLTPSRPVPLDTSLSPSGRDPSGPTDDEIDAEAARRTATATGVRNPDRYRAQCAADLRSTGWHPGQTDSTSSALPDAATVMTDALPDPDEIAPPPPDLRPHRRTG